MTAPPDFDTAASATRILGVVDAWEFGCCAPRPVVGAITWWRWTFHPELTVGAAAPHGELGVFTHRWMVASTRRLTTGSVALELRSGDFVAWWLADDDRGFSWVDRAVGDTTVPAADADSLVGRTLTVRGRMVGGRHGGGPDGELPYLGARVLGMAVLGRRWLIDNHRSRTTLGPTPGRRTTGPPQFWSYPESDDPPVESHDDSVLLELSALPEQEAARARRLWQRPRTLPIDELRALLTSVAPLRPGTMLTSTLHTADRAPALPPGFRPPRHPHEWTTQDTELLGDGAVTTLHRLTRIRRLGPTDRHRDGAEREDYPDGTPRLIRSGRRRWRFHHWPNDSFRVLDDRELTAVESTGQGDSGPPTPPRPTGWQALVDGDGPIGEIRATTFLGRPCWTYTRPGPARTPWAVVRVIVDAETGWLVAESRHGGWSQVVFSELRVEHLPDSADLHDFDWTGPSRPIEWFSPGWAANSPVRPT